MLIGWSFPQITLGFYLFLNMTIVIQWQLNHGTCLLTNLENYLMPKEKQIPKDQQGQFIRGLFLKFLGKSPSDRTLLFVIYGAMYLCFTLALIRVV